ncbi:MAG: hypothetical protein JWM76_1263, partial [Pseudonocardiales bacterium]|nr:hypothetical protein [Pseudonocardiales bacterium]
MTPDHGRVFVEATDVSHVSRIVIDRSGFGNAFTLEMCA